MESTTSTEITDFEWRAARACGLLLAAPGTNAQDKAIHAFAKAIESSMMNYQEKFISLLVELHDDEVLTESQCAKYLGVDILDWRIISSPMAHSFEQEPTGE